MAYVAILSTNESSIRVRLDDCDTSYAASDRSLLWYLDGVLKTTTSLGAYAYSSSAYTFSGLSANTSYYIEAVVTNGRWSASFTATAQTSGISALRPTNWTWTSDETNAFNNKGSTKALSRVRWNAFLDRINSFVDYVNAAHGRSIVRLSNDYYMGTDKKMYANSFNKVVEKIGELTGNSMSGITLPRARGNPIKGVYFTYMSNILNSI